MANLVIIEDNPLIREGLKTLFGNSAEHVCLGAFSSCESFLNSDDADNTEILLIDITSPDNTGLKKISMLKNSPFIIVLTVYGEHENLFSSILAGAHGYILKKTPTNQILIIIQEVLEKRSRMSAAIADKILKHLKIVKVVNGSRKKSLLDIVEKKILVQMAEGNSAAAVAQNLNLDLFEIQKHFFGIYSKLQNINTEIESTKV